MKGRITNKLFAIVFMVALLVCAMAVSASAATTRNGLVYEIVDGKVTITDYTGSATVVVIPATIEGCPVTSIGEWAFDSCTSLIIISIPDSVTSIGDYAFNYCTSLASISIPDSVTSIGDYAFYYCTSLTSITIHEGVTNIGEWAFSNCSNLTSITIPAGVTSIGNSAFSYCTSLERITIPEGVTSIGDSAFYECKSLMIISIPDSVTSIGDSAFYKCTWLTSITIPAGVTSIGDRAFSGCTRLTRITIPEGVTSIGEQAFFYCTSLTSITIPDSVTSIGNSAFGYCTSLTSIELPEGVTSIVDNAFYYCERLTSITIPEGVTSIGNNAFDRCRSLTSITIPGSVTSIGDDAFYWCSSLKRITIPAGVTSIGDYAFYDCTSLTSITIPDSVTRIGDGAFDCCSSLTSMTVEEGNTVYQSQGNCIIERETKTLVLGCQNSIIPSDGSVTSIGDSAFYWCTRLTSITIPEGVTSIGNYAFDYCTSLTSITIPDSVTSIGYCAFADCERLYITIPDSVTSIGSSAFYNTAYYNYPYNWDSGVLYIDNALIEAKTYIRGDYVIKNGTKVIGNYAFSDCTSLTSITIPDSVTSIGSGAFSDCTSLTSITIPDSVTSIGYRAFRDCSSLTSITIPDSVTSIGNEAFSDCESLETVYYAGKEEQWDQVSISSGNNYLISADVIFGRCAAYGHKWTAATCTKAKTCTVCKATEGKALGHSYKTTVTKATLTKNGSTVKKCTKCGNVQSKTTIKSVKTVKLSANTFVYNGKARKPAVTVKDSAGKTLKKGTDYTVTYAAGRKNIGTYKVTVKMIGKYSGTKTLSFKINPINISKCEIVLSNTSYVYDGQSKIPSVIVLSPNGTKLTESTYTLTYSLGRKNVGTYKVTIKMKGNYSGTKVLTFKILPKAISIGSIKAGVKSFAVSWKPNTSMTGYEIQYSTAKNFSGAKKVTVTKAKNKSTTVKKLTKGKTYYVRIRTYKTVGKVKFYSAWSAIKSVKAK